MCFSDIFQALWCRMTKKHFQTWFVALLLRHTDAIICWMKRSLLSPQSWLRWLMPKQSGVWRGSQHQHLTVPIMTMKPPLISGCYVDSTTEGTRWQSQLCWQMFSRDPFVHIKGGVIKKYTSTHKQTKLLYLSLIAIVKTRSSWCRDVIVQD